MELLKGREICKFSDDIEQNGLMGLVVLYEKVEAGYTIHFPFPNDINELLINMLSTTNAGKNAGDVRVHMFSEKFNDFSFVALASVKSDDLVESSRKAAFNGVKAFVNINVCNISLCVDFMPHEMGIGSVLAAYKYTLFNKQVSQKIKLSGFSMEKNEVSISFFNKGVCVGEHQNFARFLGDTPANHMTPTLFVEYAKDFLPENVEIEVYEKEYCVEKKMNLFMSVAHGSAQPPKLLVVKYKGKKGEVGLALVGKGITFDSGGISLKTPGKMAEMKGDMMGAATCLAAIGLAAKFESHLKITATIPLCENLPSSTATKPGDVFIGMGDISVEVDNTDAEGRLILADALTHAQLENPKYLIDVATLTGAIGVALGNHYMGLFSNDDEFADLIYQASLKIEDRVWRMPLCKKYRGNVDSTVADLKNIGTNGGGSCTAAIFLNDFIKKESKWAHLDIASTMIVNNGMSGKPTRLLYEIIEQLSTMVSKK